jgi:hypothetical protein
MFGYLPMISAAKISLRIISNDGKRFGKDVAGSFLTEFKTQFQHSSEGGHRRKQGKRAVGIYSLHGEI